MRLWGFVFSWSGLLRGGMPASTAFGHDSHSDKEAARAFCPSFLKASDGFDVLGSHLLQFLGNMMFSPWLSSIAYDFEDLVRNTFAGYYMLLGAVFHAWDLKGKRWPLHFMPRNTVRNLVLLACTLKHRDASHWQ